VTECDPIGNLAERRLTAAGVGSITATNGGRLATGDSQSEGPSAFTRLEGRSNTGILGRGNPQLILYHMYIKPGRGAMIPGSSIWRENAERKEKEKEKKTRRSEPENRYRALGRTEELNRKKSTHAIISS